MNSIEYEKLNTLVQNLHGEPEKLLSSFTRILDSTNNAYKELHKKHSKIKSENKHLKNQKDILVKSEKMASLKQLAMGLAHEINNPISFIISNLNTLQNYINTINNSNIEISLENGSTKKYSLKELLNSHTSDDIKYIIQDIPELVNESQEGAHRIKEIIKELMFFKKPEANYMRYANINDIIESCLTLATRQIEHKVFIKKNLAILPEIKCYPEKLKQVFLNLIINAFDAISEKGYLNINTKLLKNSILIIFSDTGMGIKQKHINKIFDPFFTTKEIGQGMGLGLSTVFSIIKLHNGNIEVDSKVNKGTAFTILLPCGKKDIDASYQKLLEV